MNNLFVISYWTSFRPQFSIPPVYFPTDKEQEKKQNPNPPRQVYKEEASFIREGNGFPTLLRIRDALARRNILILPIVDCEAGAHSEAENISLRCYIEGTKLLASYFYALPIAAANATKGRGRRDVCRDRLMWNDEINPFFFCSFLF